jgi:hypothetical protein
LYVITRSVVLGTLGAVDEGIARGALAQATSEMHARRRRDWAVNVDIGQ